MPSSTSLMPSFWPPEDGRDVDALAEHADAAAGGDEDVTVVEGIVDVGQALICTRRRSVDFRGTFHGEGLVGSFLVELADEAVEADLLLKEIAAGRAGCFTFQGKMHPLMATVLLGMAGLDAFDGDAQAQPPDREF